MPAVPVILVCDDDPDDQILIEGAFSEAHIRANFQFTSDGRQLIDYLEHCSTKVKKPCPNIILLDINMPGMDGKQTLTWIKSRSDYRAIPVVMYTTSTDESDIHQCYQLGANSYMTKCASFEALVDKANSFSKYWMETAMLPPK